MKKKLVCAALSAALLCGTASAAAWPQWAQDARDWAAQREISEALLAAPEAAVTRGQAAQLLYEAAGRPAVSDDTPFTDVPAAYADATAWAAAKGYIKGVGGGRFLPDQLVTRQEFATMLYRSAGEPAVTGKELQAYTDAAQVSGWAQDAMLWCNKTGVISGKTAEQLAPGDTIIMAEAVLILQRSAMLPDTGTLAQDLQTLTAQHRPIGSAASRRRRSICKAASRR